MSDLMNYNLKKITQKLCKRRKLWQAEADKFGKHKLTATIYLEWVIDDKMNYKDESHHWDMIIFMNNVNALCGFLH